MKSVGMNRNNGLNEPIEIKLTILQKKKNKIFTDNINVWYESRAHSRLELEWQKCLTKNCLFA